MTELPTTFGKYFLTEKLATGGMAEIYLAKLVGPGGFEKSLVIKQIHPRLSGQRHFVDLFVTEAKTLVTLTHGNIVPVYELGVIDDTYFIAMEYIDGPTLYRLTESLSAKGARMDPPLAAFICARILEGLDYAHRKGEGVIHRDLSPRNVMLSRDGDIKLVDFGIAVTLGAADDSGAESAPTGSFPYMSPEQVRRESLTGQTDLFSAGVLLWEMLVGERLFARKDPDATLAAVTDEVIPRPSEKRPEIPAKLDEVVMRALERDQDTRWPSAGEMLAQLQRYLYALDEPPNPRDAAALVAKFCPPETRRLPTHVEAHAGDTEATPPPAGPRTAVIPRDATPAKGKQPRARTETFATNVELKEILERATPMFGVDVMPEASAGAKQNEEDDDEVIETRTSQRSMPRAERSSIMPLGDASRPIPVPGRTAPSRGILVAAAIGTILLGVVAVFLFMKNRGAGVVVDAEVAVASDAAPGVIDAPPDAPDPDASLVDASLADAFDPDAGPARDAGPRTKPDASSATTPVDAAPVVRGTAVLKVGANPWGEVVIDGIGRGRTPFEVTLPAGRHVVEIIFKGEDPPRSTKKSVDLKAGATETIEADFTKP
ncbi:MAG: protein kinase [Myxococcota bacterium]|nr:protein kinase [Myxococcota bacterium]